jgi:hypothetical protein
VKAKLFPSLYQKFLGERVIICLAGVVTILWVNSRNQIFSNFWWDVSVYSGKIDEFKKGLSPYEFNGHNNRLAVPSYFPYHPYIFRLFYYFDQVVHIEIILALLFVVSLIILMSSLYFFVSPGITNSSAIKLSLQSFLIAITFGGSSLVALSSGNIAFPLHALCLAVSLNLLRNPSTINTFSFISVIAISSFCKPYFFAYVLIYLFTFKKTFTKAILHLVLLFSVLNFVWFSSYFFDRENFFGYLNSIQYMTFGLQDFGFSAFSILRSQLGNGFALFGHIFFLILYLILPRLRNQKDDTYYISIRTVYFLALVLIIVSSNPRMKEYDFGILFFVLVYFLLYLPKRSYFRILALLSLFILLRICIVLMTQQLNFYLPPEWLYLRYWEIAITWLMYIFLVFVAQPTKESTSLNIFFGPKFGNKIIRLW